MASIFLRYITKYYQSNQISWAIVKPFHIFFLHYIHTHTTHCHIYMHSCMPIKYCRGELLIQFHPDASAFLGANTEKMIFFNTKKNH